MPGSDALFHVSRQMLELITQSAPVSIVYVDAQERIQFITDRHLELLGCSARDVLGHTVMEVLGPQDYDRIAPTLRRALQGEPTEADLQMPYPGAGPRQVRVRYTPHQQQGSEVVGVMAIIEDLTDHHEALVRLQASDELLQRQTERAQERTEQRSRALLDQLLLAQDAERRRIARELHDGLGQVLSALRVLVEAALREVGRETAGPARQQLHDLLDGLDDEVDRAIFELRPLALEGQGLVEAVTGYVELWSRRSDWSVDLQVTGLDSVHVSPRVEGAGYRVVQEAMLNVAKHAHARHVDVVLSYHDGHLIVTVQDDGRGFDTEPLFQASEAGGWGLIGLRERVWARGGDLQIESAHGRGTLVTARIPAPRCID